MRQARHQPPEHVGPEGCLTRLFLRGDLASRADTRLMHVPSFAVRVLHQDLGEDGLRGVVHDLGLDRAVLDQSLLQFQGAYCYDPQAKSERQVLH